jgi:proteasome lid subunit RPN8/RPN11
MRVVPLILGLVFASHPPARSTPQFDFRRADNAALMDILRDLAGKGALLPDETEIGAFIVRKTDGELSCLLWPRTHTRRSARYTGAMPPGVVAIAHTHPPHFPHPSLADVGVARRMGLPSYVVSRRDVFVIDPSSGDSIALLANESWTGSRHSKTGLPAH